MIRTIGTVLLVEHDESEARKISKALLCNGFSVKASDEPEQAFALIGAYHFDALILEYSTCCHDPRDLRRWVQASSESCPVALLADRVPDSVASEARGMGVRLILGKPPDLETLVSFARSSVRRKTNSESFSGKAEQIDLLSYVQFLVLDRKNIILEVSSFDGYRGEIFISNGEILHARFGDTQGEKALFQCLAFKGGSFAHRPWHPPTQATIKRSADALLFDAARMRDEAKQHPE